MFEQTLLAALTTGAIFSVLVSGFSLTLGTMSVVDFAYGGYVVVGALCSARLPLIHQGFVDVVVRLIVGLASGAAVAAVVYAAVLIRLVPRGHLAQLIATLGVGLVIQGCLVQFFGSDALSTKSRSLGGDLHVGHAAIPDSRAAAAAIGVVAVALFGAFLARSRTGKAWRAVAVNPLGAVLSGVSLRRLRLLAGTVSGALAGLSGALLVAYLPISAFDGLEYLIVSFLVVSLGGVRSVVGPVIAAFVFAIVDGLSSAYLPDLIRGSAVYIVIAICVVLLPTGIATIWTGRERLV